MKIIPNQREVDTYRAEIRDKSIPVPFAGCWLWEGRLNDKGYGTLRRANLNNGKTTQASRLSYAAFYGEPGSRVVMHSCDTPACVNPDHLVAGTLADNNLDCKRKGRTRGGRPEVPVDATKLAAVKASGCTVAEAATTLGVTWGVAQRRLKKQGSQLGRPTAVSLRAIRFLLSLGYSQSRVAAILGVSPSTISKQLTRSKV